MNEVDIYSETFPVTEIVNNYFGGFANDVFYDFLKFFFIIMFFVFILKVFTLIFPHKD